MRAFLALIVGAVTCVLGCVVPVPADAAFEVEPGSFKITTSSSHAGAHPDLTTSFALARDGTGSVEGLLRSMEVVLPAGLTVYSTAVKTCDPVQLQFAECPTSAQIGTIEVELRVSAATDLTITEPLYNMASPAGSTAVYGFVADEFVAGTIVVSVGPESRVRASAKDLFSSTELLRQSLSLWGVPAAAAHNAQRGDDFKCRQINEAAPECTGGGTVASESPAAYLVNPTRCTEAPLAAELRDIESWEGETSPPQQTTIGPFINCESLRFAPTVVVAPEETQASTPTGYEVDLRVPQTESAEGLASADLEDAVVTLPAGVVLSPSAANGLQACTEAQVGLGSEQPVECPNASKLGVASVITPALSGELKGALYLGGPPSGPITGPPFTVYLTLEGHGAFAKVRGTVAANPTTGQLTTTFDESPELPFSELKLHLTGGSRAPLANPRACTNAEGVPVEYSAESELTPWTAPFESPVMPSSPPFEVTGCQGPRFDPTFVAGTTNNQAGAPSPLIVTFSRQDADEELGAVTITLPPGLSWNVTSVPLCGEPQAAEGTCPEASQIGEVTVGAGPGPEPYFVTGGKVFLTEPYDGAPFGLSIDVPEKAGPFDFGSGPCDCEVVRASVAVNPSTAQLTVTTGALPTGKDGIPFQVKTVNVEINRPDFTFNPTDCEPLAVDAQLTSTAGLTSQQAYRFQDTNCPALGVNPQLAVSTSGVTSSEDGASLVAKLPTNKSKEHKKKHTTKKRAKRHQKVKHRSRHRKGAKAKKRG